MFDSPELLFQEALQKADVLETKIDHLQGWLVFATCFLILGVILEYYEYLPPPLIRLVRSAASRYRGLQHRHIPQKIGRCLVVLMLAILAGVEFASMRLQTALREANSQISVELSNKLYGEGARSRVLLGDGRQTLIAPLRRYKGERVEVRFCEETSADREINDLISLLNIPVFQAAGWQVSKPMPVPCQSQAGVLVQVLPSSSSRTKGAANALVSALLKNRLNVVGAKVQDWPIGDPLPRDSNTVVIYVFPRV